MTHPVLIAAVALTAIAASPAEALTLRGDVPPRLERWVAMSRMPTPDREVVVHLENCPGYDTPTACAVPGEIWLYPGSGRREFWHELGHQYDYVMPDATRAAFEYIMDDGRPWHSTPNSPHEQFAEAWRLCAAVRWLTNYSTKYGYDPSQHQHDQVCALIRG